MQDQARDAEIAIKTRRTNKSYMRSTKCINEKSQVKLGLFVDKSDYLYNAFVTHDLESTPNSTLVVSQDPIRPQ